MRQEIYNYIQEEELDTSNVDELFDILKGVKEKISIPKSVVNNHIVSNSYNLRLRVITNESIPHPQYDVEIPNKGGLTLRLAAQAGLDWLLADSGAEVNPLNVTLNNLLDLLNSAGVFTNEEISAFWELFENTKWPTLSLSDVKGALNTPQIELTTQRIQETETIHETLTSRENVKQSVRSNELNTMRLMLNELELGISVDVPEIPSGEDWE